MRLWFSPATEVKQMWDRHYHEFEDWQLDWLWKTGWKIIDRQNGLTVNKMSDYVVSPWYYIVYAERIK
jgi:hypothetical protein